MTLIDTINKLHNKLLKISCNISYSWTFNFWINFIHEYQDFTHDIWYLCIIMIFSSKCIFRKFFYKVFFDNGHGGNFHGNFHSVFLKQVWKNGCTPLLMVQLSSTCNTNLHNIHVHFLMLKWSPFYYIFAYFLKNLNLTSSNFLKLFIVMTNDV
jgi:hypothetical protein